MRLGLEELGRRDVPSMFVTGGQLVAVGTQQADVVLIQPVPNDPDHFTAMYVGGDGFVQMTLNAADIHSVMFLGWGGNDYYANNLISNFNGQGAGNSNAIFNENLNLGDGDDYCFLGACNVPSITNVVDMGAGNDYANSNGYHGGVNIFYGGTGFNTLVCDSGIDLFSNFQVVYNFNPNEDHQL